MTSPQALERLEKADIKYRIENEDSQTVSLTIYVLDLSLRGEGTNLGRAFDSLLYTLKLYKKQLDILTEGL